MKALLHPVGAYITIAAVQAPPGVELGAGLLLGKVLAADDARQLIGSTVVHHNKAPETVLLNGNAFRLLDLADVLGVLELQDDAPPAPSPAPPDAAPTPPASPAALAEAAPAEVTHG